MFLDDIVSKINEEEIKTEGEPEKKDENTENKKRRDGLITYSDEFYKAIGK